MEICIYLKAYLHKIWWHLNFNFNFEIYFRKLFNEEALIQGRSRSQNNFIDTSGVIFLCIANEKYFQFETQQRICLLAIVNWTYCFSILYSPEYQFQFPHSQIHLYCIELCLREEAVVQVLHRGIESFHRSNQFHFAVYWSKHAYKFLKKRFRKKSCRCQE